MLLPDYRLVGSPGRFKNGHGGRAQCYAQRFRLLHERPRRVRSVSLQTTDAAVARRRAVRYVEARVREIQEGRDPEARTANRRIEDALSEYIGNLLAVGNSAKQASLVKQRIKAVIRKARLKEYAQVDAVTVTKAIASLKTEIGFKATTANKYREALRAWTRWAKKNGRWPSDPLADMPKFKGDTSNSRPRAILTDPEFELLLCATRGGPVRRNLTGEQRYWLYLLASQTGLRAQELNSLSPASFHLDAEQPYVEVHCTISKRRTTDRILLRQDFAALLRPWLRQQPAKRRLWANSRSWFYKAPTMLRQDLQASGVSHERKTNQGISIIDFHSFRAYRVTKAMMSGKNSRVVMATVRLSCESLLNRYVKIPSSEITDCTEAVPLPRLPSGASDQ